MDDFESARLTVAIFSHFTVQVELLMPLAQKSRLIKALVKNTLK